jgi:hypothetical protein
MRFRCCIAPEIIVPFRFLVCVLLVREGSSVMRASGKERPLRVFRLFLILFFKFGATS